jgi:indole-3-acetate monooxygenase
MPAPTRVRTPDALGPMIRARRDEIERARQLPRDVADALRATGIFRLAVPRAIGGVEAQPQEILRTIETLAAADGSVGWCAMVGISNNGAAGYMDERGAREVFADPTAPAAGIAAPAGAAVPVDGGLRVSGRWPFASGITHSDWLWAGCLVTENGRPRMTPRGPEIVHVCMPVREVQIHDTWFVSGLCGTGSHDVSAADVFVPAHRVFALLDPAEHRKEALYQLPVIGWFVSQLATVALGIGRGALDEFYELAQTAMPTFSQVPLADKPVAQIEIAHAEAALNAARAFLHESVDTLWAAACAGREPSPRDIAINRMAAAHAAESGAAAARTASVLAGGRAVYSASPLQRHVRDSDAVAHHFTMSRSVWEDAGRVLLGRQPTVPVF